MADTTTKIKTEKKRSGIADFFVRLIREKPMGLIGGIITVLLLLVGIFAPLLAPYGPNVIHGLNAMEGPSFKFWMGTDWLGRDILSRVIYGARISLVVGLAATLIATVVEIVIGVLSGYIGGKFDLIVQRFVDAVMCFPALIILMVIISIIHPSMINIILVLGVQMGIGGSRVIRSAVIGIKENLYIQSAVAIGAPTWDVIRRHIVPNIMAPIIIEFSTRMPAVILTEASLSFLGYGIPPPSASLGALLSGSARTYMFQSPWMVLWPGLVLSVVVWGVNMFGDAVRDILDPRLRGGIGRYGLSKKSLEKISNRSNLPSDVIKAD
ncbi:MAG: ABC transporter permease [Dehalococcoidales bacterium]